MHIFAPEQHDLYDGPEGDLALAMGKWNEFNPCQNGGIVAYIHEHGTDSGCGDNNWPKDRRVPRRTLGSCS